MSSASGRAARRIRSSERGSGKSEVSGAPAKAVPAPADSKADCAPIRNCRLETISTNPKDSRTLCRRLPSSQPPVCRRPTVAGITHLPLATRPDRGRGGLDHGNVQKHPSGRRGANQRAGGAGRPARGVKHLRGPRGAGPDPVARPCENADRHHAHDVLPALPAVELREVVRPHEPDETHARIARDQRLDGLGGEAGAEARLDIRDDDPGCVTTAFAAAMRRSSGAGPRSFSGLPGLTSHQTRSSPRRFSASRLTCTCPACGGSKEPPKRPTVIPARAMGQSLRCTLRALRVVAPVSRSRTRCGKAKQIPGGTGRAAGPSALRPAIVHAPLNLGPRRLTPGVEPVRRLQWPATSSFTTWMASPRPIPAARNVSKTSV